MLADAHRSLGQFDQAAAALEQAAQANPRYYLALGDVYERQDKWEEAADAYEKGLGATRGSGRELRLRRAAALLNVPDGGGAERAIAVLTEFLKANPKDIAGQMLLAQAYLQRGARRRRRARGQGRARDRAQQPAGPRAARRRLPRALRLRRDRVAADADHPRRRDARRPAGRRVRAPAGGTGRRAAAGRRVGGGGAHLRTRAPAAPGVAAGCRGPGAGPLAGRAVRASRARGPRCPGDLQRQRRACCASRRSPASRPAVLPTPSASSSARWGRSATSPARRSRSPTSTKPRGVSTTRSRW